MAPTNKVLTFYGVNIQHMTPRALIVAIALLVSSCKKDEGSTTPAVPDPIASFTYGGATVTPASISFQNTSQYADSFVWNFGDSSTSTATSPTKVFPVHGNYTVTLTAMNTTSGRSCTKSEQITITPGRVFVDVIDVEQIPFANGSGIAWDVGSGPDLYPTFRDYDHVLVTFRSSYFNDLEPEHLPMTWILSPSHEITDWAKPHFVECWDHDPLGDDDYIGTPYGFAIRDVIATSGYAAYVRLQNSDGTIKAGVILRWQ